MTVGFPSIASKGQEGRSLLSVPQKADTRPTACAADSSRYCITLSGSTSSRFCLSLDGFPGFRSGLIPSVLD